MCLENGGDGIVFGCLTELGTVDVSACARLISHVRAIKPDCPITFHRAIDMTPSVIEAAKQVYKLGFDRILTSGGFQTAFEGRHVIKEMVEMFKDDGPIIVPGAGINKDNLVQILEATGAKEFHGSASIKVASNMKFMNEKLSLGGGDCSEYSIKMTSVESVRALCQLFKKR
eukprot:TRINITY_DN18875_c0_g1_i2.p1 TRINITY_DN18875_c0_g1~~TRINITY_DN18875_c0_g1_i2.p1  ORF type:complete len:190 (-),score=30.84 TRINITY_DN18875_c0_g1_i2:99-614(-)